MKDGKFNPDFYGSTSDIPVLEKPAASGVSRLEDTPKTGISAGELASSLSDASVLTLDGYGTLVDRESGIIGELMPWLLGVGVTAGRGEILRAFHQEERAHLTPGTAYRDVLIRVHDALADFFGVAPDPKAAADFAGSVGRWPVHADVPEALAYLREHFQLVVVTNADHSIFDVTSEALGVTFDAVYTAEDSGSYKPNVGMFSYALERLADTGIDKGQVIHVAGSIEFDHVPAKELGMVTCWIDRNHARRRPLGAKKRVYDVHPDFRFKTLGALAEAHWLERQAA